MKSRALFPIAAALWMAGLLGGQQFRVDTDLILVPVIVTDGRGANITGLRQESFTVLDNGRPQNISAFYIDDAPCTVGIVIDSSGSMRSSLSWEKAAVRTFLDHSNPADDFFATVVNSKPMLLSPSGTELETISDQARLLTAGGWTALYDTIRLAANDARRSKHPCRALLVISDGVDNHSRIERSELMQFLMEADVQVYTIAIRALHPDRKGIQLAEDQRGIAFLHDLAAKTGGLSLEVRDSDNPAKAAALISSALRDRYVLGFRSPDSGASEQWHSIQVKINGSKAHVYARGGYRISSELP